MDRRSGCSDLGMEQARFDGLPSVTNGQTAREIVNYWTRTNKRKMKTIVQKAFSMSELQSGRSKTRTEPSLRGSVDQRDIDRDRSESNGRWGGNPYRAETAELTEVR